MLQYRAKKRGTGKEGFYKSNPNGDQLEQIRVSGQVSVWACTSLLLHQPARGLYVPRLSYKQGYRLANSTAGVHYKGYKVKD